MLRSLRLRWFSLRCNGWVDNKEKQRHFRRGTVVICVGSSSNLLNPCTGIGGLVYALAMQYSSILYVLFGIKVVKCKLCESTSRFGGMKMLPRAVCSSTHFALVAIRLWTSWALIMILVYLRIEQSPGSCFLWGCAMLFR